MKKSHQSKFQWPGLSKISRGVLVFISLLGSLSLLAQNERYWVAATPANWSSNNWSYTSGGTPDAPVPTNGDIVFFDNNGLGDCTLTTDATILGMLVEDDYSGTIDLGDNEFTVGSENLTLRGGSFNGNTAAITIQGNLEVFSPTNFTATADTLRMLGSGFNQFILVTTFDNNSGTVHFSNGNYEIELGGAFYNMILEDDVSFYTDLVVENNLSLNQGSISSYTDIEILDSLVVGADFGSLQGVTLSFKGTGNGHFISNTVLRGADIIVEKAMNTDTVHCYAGTVDVLAIGDGEHALQIIKGGMDFPAGDPVHMYHTLVQVADDGFLIGTRDTLRVKLVGESGFPFSSFEVNPNGYFHNEGTFVFEPCADPADYFNYVCDDRLYNAIVEGSVNSGFSDLITENSLLLNAGTLQVNAVVLDSVTVNSGFGGMGGTTLRFEGSGNGHFISNSLLLDANIRVEKAMNTDTVHCYAGTVDVLAIGDGEHALQIIKGGMDFPAGDPVHMYHTLVQVADDGFLIGTRDTLRVKLVGESGFPFSSFEVNPNGYFHNEGTFVFEPCADPADYFNYVCEDRLYNAIVDGNIDVFDDLITENSLLLNADTVRGEFIAWDSVTITTNFGGFDDGLLTFAGAGNGHFIVNDTLTGADLIVNKEMNTDTVHCYAGTADVIAIGGGEHELRIEKGGMDFPLGDPVNFHGNRVEVWDDGFLIGTSDTLRMRLDNWRYTNSLGFMFFRSSRFSVLGTYAHNAGTIEFEPPTDPAEFLDYICEDSLYNAIIGRNLDTDDYGELTTENSLFIDSIELKGAFVSLDSVTVDTNFVSLHNGSLRFAGTENGHFILNDTLFRGDLIIDKEMASDTVHCYSGLAETIDLGDGTRPLIILKGSLDFPDGEVVHFDHSSILVDTFGVLIASTDTLYTRLSGGEFTNDGSFFHNDGTLAFVGNNYSYDGREHENNRFNNVCVDLTGTWEMRDSYLDTMTNMMVADTLRQWIEGDFSFVDGRISGKPALQCLSDVHFGPDAVQSNADFFLVGTADQNLSMTTAHQGFTTINKPLGTVFLQDTLYLSTQVQQTLLLENGPLDINELSLIQTWGDPMSIRRDSGYIRSENEKSFLVWKNLNSVTEYVFPFGVSDSKYVPVTVSSTDNLDSVAIATLATDPLNLPYPTGISDLDFLQNGEEVPLASVDRFWKVIGTELETFTVALPVHPSEIAEPNIICLPALEAYGNSGNTWSPLLTMPIPIDADSVAASGVSGTNWLALFDPGGGVEATITCPPDLVLDCDEDTSPDYTGMATVTGAAMPNTTFTDALSPLAQGYLITRTWTTTDNCGNLLSCEQSITVLSCEPQLMDPCSCLNNASAIDLDTGLGGDDGQFSELVAITGLNGAPIPANPLITWQVFSSSGGVDAFAATPVAPAQTAGMLIPDGTELFYNPVTGHYELPFYHYDGVGYSLSVQQFVNGMPGQILGPISNNCVYPNPVFDPVLQGLYCPDAPAFTLGGVDNSGLGADAVSFTIDGNAATQLDPSALSVGFHTVIMIWDGAAGTNNGSGTMANPNEPGCEQSVQKVIEVNDTEEPVITCPPDVTIECDEDSSPANTGMATVTDNCNTAPALTFADMITPGACPQESTITRTWTATDGIGLTASCVQIITVEDTTAPVPVCNTITIFLSTAGQYTVTQADIDAIAAGSMDNCDADFTYGLDQTFFDCSDIDLNIGIIGGAEIELTVTDCVGNSDVCTAIVEIDDSAVPFEFGCIADLNVTLGDDCSATITPDMVVTGFDDCIDSYNLMVDGLDSDQAVGCGEHTYMIELIEDGEIVYTCWGTLFAEDKTDPVVECPDDTDFAIFTSSFQVIEGELDGTEPTLNLTDFSCFNDAISPLAGDHNYDLITFSVSTTDVYTFFVGSLWDGNMALFQGDFNPDNPCENIIGQTEDTYYGDNSDFDTDILSGPSNVNPAYRLALPLIAGRTYTLMISNQDPTDLGDWFVVAQTDNGSAITGAGIPPAFESLSFFPLFCDDIDEVLISGEQTYVVNASGDIVSISPELETILGYTGFPEVSDNCGDVLVTVSDVVSAAGDCGDVTITRTFHVVDRYNSDCVGDPRMDDCAQLISFFRPNVSSVILPPYTAPIECDEGFATDGDLGGPDDNPHASVTGYPWLQTAFGNHDLESSYCNIGASYSDSPRIIVCDGTYEFRRQWNIIDWCDPSNSFTWDQFVRVGDFTGPEISGIADVINVSTSPFSCLANIAIPCPTVVDANGCSSASATTWTVLAFGDSFFAGGDLCEGDVVQAPIGEHTLIVCASDDCGNETCEEYTVVVRDDIEPTAICDDELNVSIGGGDVANGVEGIARVFAVDFDEGSNDNCGEVTVEVRRNFWRDGTCNDSANRWSPWGEFVDFYCCDIGNEITIELRVTDEAGNQNICWEVVTPEDKLNPFCYAPEDVELTCAELPLAFPGNIQDAYDNDFGGTSDMMNAIFGAATGTDNCAVDTIVERTPNIQINECGWGTITRRFEAWQLEAAGDLNGNGAIDINEVLRSTNNCTQEILITEVHDFVIDFPQDAEADCGEPTIPTIITESPGCDVLSINIGEPAVFAATGDECYKLSITYDVINWCLWDGEYTGYELPRITEDDGEALPVDRAVEGNERPVVHYSTIDGLRIDRNHTDRAGDSSIPDASPVIPNYGRYIYTQFVKVYDSTTPVITVGDYGGPTDLCPDLMPGQFGDADGDCMAEVDIPFTVTDECELFDGAGNLVINIVSAELDAFAVDVNGDGQINANEFLADDDVTANLTDNGDGTYAFAGTFPIITDAMGENIVHVFRVLLEDGCGNQMSEYVEFDVIDCKGPAPICINGLTVTLMPQQDGDCAMTIWASDFEGSPIYDCTGQGPDVAADGRPRITAYAIYRAVDVEAAGDNFIPHPSNTGLVLTSDDDPTTVVYIYAFDEDGNYDYCETYVLVQQHASCDPTNTATIAGAIQTEDNDAVENVTVNLNGEMSMSTTTAVDGYYQFSSLMAGGDYSVTPYLNSNPLNGVSTFDIILISKHVLGTQLLDSPYKLIAADVNRSNTITTLDLIQIRKLILNINTEFSNNTSWRFVHSDYDFPQPTNPWLEEFPELHNENNLIGEILDADFVGVKIGDVNGSAQANALSGEERNLNGQFDLWMEDMQLLAGNHYTIDIYGDDLGSWSGFQGTMEWREVSLLDISEGLADEGNLGKKFWDDGFLTMSWNQPASKVEGQRPLFGLHLMAHQDMLLSEAVIISDRFTRAEAYGAGAGDLARLGIAFGGALEHKDEFELYQNIPNPFNEQTLLSFYLPEASEVTLEVRDVTGRLLFSERIEYVAGYHTRYLDSKLLKKSSGVLSYSLQAGEFFASKKMVLLRE